ncbi:DUF3182 family protein [Luteimonas suaedae]|uniref:DUF3182 family protein n=1 Tax=Luteimonas suaedae TaxID=2605430 RepID=UPI0011EC1628|nr:DUF3182 family protein [Luteimonas suaedae]
MARWVPPGPGRGEPQGHGVPAPRHVTAYATRPLPEDGHERGTLEWVARQVAALGGVPYHGLCAAQERPAAATYLVPDATLCSAPSDDPLVPMQENGLLGGVVPYPFVATKVVGHPLVDGAGAAPLGWVPDLGAALAEATVPGYAAFTVEDALRAARKLRREGHHIRLKQPEASGGSGQLVVHDPLRLRAVLAATPGPAMVRHGVVLEADLLDPSTYSVGTITCWGFRIAYIGRQHMTRDGHGHPAYGGSDLAVIRGDLRALQRATRHSVLREVVDKAIAYDARIGEAFPAFFSSRRNYDVIDGTDAAGRRVCGVLEQSWRVGGATPAELGAIGLMLADARIERVCASTRERYGRVAVPPDAEIYHCGMRPGAGLLTKYRQVSAHGGQAYAR